MSKLYAIRDRLIAYYLQPFVGPNDKDVLGAIAQSVNDEESNHAISKTPHQFEIWSLAEIDQESGIVVPKLELISDCSSLVRTGVRERPERGRETLHRPNGGQPKQASQPPGHTRSAPSAAQGAAQPEDPIRGKKPTPDPGSIDLTGQEG